MSELDFLRTCAILHDIGKPECWANRKPWSEHIHWTYKIVKEGLGDDYALSSMRHHTGRSYASEYHPQTKIEKTISLADNFASGADRPEEPEHGTPLPKPPIHLTHVLSREKIRNSLDEARLAYISQTLMDKLKKLSVQLVERPSELYMRIFEILWKSELRELPADTREPINDVSLWDHLKLTAAFATCIWTGEGYKGDNPEKYEFALLSGDADKISGYINVSRRLPDLNARSNIIKSGTSEAARYLREMLGPECVIYAGGGSFLALSPKNMAEKAVLGAKDAFENATKGDVTITVNSVSANGKDIRDDFGGVWKRAQNEMHALKRQRIIIPQVSIDEGVDVCDVCQTHPWVREDHLKILRINAAPRPERLCESCWTLRMEGTGVELEELKSRGKSNFVALLKADGDDMAKLLSGSKFKELEKADTPSRLSTLSDILNRICETELAEIIRGYGGECVYAGGDDVLAFIPGEEGLKAAKSVAARFRDEMAGECTMSVGIAFLHHDLPVYAGLEAARHLLSSAKECEGKNRVAFAVIGGTGLTMDELKRHVKPRTWEDLNAILDMINFMRSSGVASSHLRKIASIASDNKESSQEKAEVVIKYSMGRKVFNWTKGKKLLGYLDTGLIGEAFMLYDLFKED